jgi:type I restriction enzyme S subunit
MKLPKGWEIQTLESMIHQPESGVSVLCDDNSEDVKNCGILRLSCVTNGRFNPSDVKVPLDNEVHRLSLFAEEDTVLISRSNTPALVGASAYVAKNFPKAFLPDTLWLLRPKSKRTLSMRWLSLLIQSDAYRLLLRRIASGTSDSMKKIQKGSFLSLKAHVPPLAEQRKIADILSTWDEALEKLDALIQAKERQKKALMQQLLTGKKRVKGSTGKVQFLRASELFTNRSERNNEKLPVLSVTQDQGVVLRSGLERRIMHDESNTDTYKVVKAGDFIISLRSFQGGLEYSEFSGAVSPAYHVIHPIIEINQSYYRHYFKSADFVSRLATAVIGIRDGKQISFTDFGFIKLPYPSIEDQYHIGKVLDTADNELRILRSQRIALDQQKRGLMQRLLTGKIRVKTPSDAE